LIEERHIELEWPSNLHMGDSDIIRLALIPSGSSYKLEAEYPEHSLVTQTAPIEHPAGEMLTASARLDGAGFSIAPSGDQEQLLPTGKPVVWRWNISPQRSGQQRLLVSVVLRWYPPAESQRPVRQIGLYSRGVDVQVSSFLGLERQSALFLGLAGLILGGGMGAGAFLIRPASRRAVLRMLVPSQSLTLEPAPGMTLTPAENAMLRALFNQYARLTLHSEFLSGYSGARTFLGTPILPDGRSDASTIIKIGPRASIQQEYENYETYVKNRLPPVTARIQHTPVSVAGSDRAALRYTFIAEPGRYPLSLRQALLAHPDPALLQRLFETFGPNWWMQRQPYSFRLATEYDRLLPPHYVIEPLSGSAPAQFNLTPNSLPFNLTLKPGDIVWVQSFPTVEVRADGKSLSLVGLSSAGQPALRLRWLDLRPPVRSLGRVVTARPQLLRDLSAGLELCGLPDPLASLPALLQENISGTRSVIHGDLNLENILVGPGGLVWLIDFAQTGEGHPLSDFAHLHAEIIAHILTPQITSPQEYLTLLQRGDHPLLVCLERIAGQCLFNPAQPREYQLALYAACLGALKYSNLTPAARQMLYLTAAFVASRL
jgi:hypothetical protein